MDAGQAEEEFANVAFEILDKNALLTILVNLDPVTVFNLCRTNSQFGRVCGDDTIFAVLMKAHFPMFPLQENAKAQYMGIVGGKAVQYHLPIINAQNTDDSVGMPIECGTVALSGSGEVRTSVNFSIMGTKIQRGRFWLAFKQVSRFGSNAQVFTTLGDAIDSFYPRSMGGYTRYVQERLSEFEFSIKTARSPDINPWLDAKDYPRPLTEDNVLRWFREKRYLHMVCRTPRSTLGRCAYVIVPFEIK